MAKSDSDILGGGTNPLTEAILEAAEDLEKGRPLAKGGDPLAAQFEDVEAKPAPLEVLPQEEAPSEEVPSEEAEQPVAVEAEPQAVSFWSRLSQANPYTVMLAVAAVALVLGMAVLLIELSRYGFEVRPHG